MVVLRTGAMHVQCCAGLVPRDALLALGGGCGGAAARAEGRRQAAGVESLDQQHEFGPPEKIGPQN
jgi:hypothetical protein